MSGTRKKRLQIHCDPSYLNYFNGFSQIYLHFVLESLEIRRKDFPLFTKNRSDAQSKVTNCLSKRMQFMRLFDLRFGFDSATM